MYLEATFLTEKEYNELVTLLDIITKVIKSSALKWTRKDLVGILPIIIPNSTTFSKISEFRKRELNGDQRSDEWLKQRHNYITASVSAACAGLMGKVARKNQLLEKATWGEYRPFKGGYYTDKGNIFEEVTNLYYCYVNKCTIYDFKLIPNDNPEYLFLGASTDGISNRLVNIEIKTLVGRSIDSKKIKKEYYHQMQHQMECIGLDSTHFIEVKYKEHDSIEQAFLHANNQAYGIIIEYYYNDNLMYYYSPIGLDLKLLKNWLEQKESDLSQTNDKFFVRTINWQMVDYLCRKVLRDPLWIKEMGPKLKKFWLEVQYLRENPNKIAEITGDASDINECLI